MSHFRLLRNIRADIFSLALLFRCFAVLPPKCLIPADCAAIKFKKRMETTAVASANGGPTVKPELALR